MEVPRKSLQLPLGKQGLLRRDFRGSPTEVPRKSLQLPLGKQEFPRPSFPNGNYRDFLRIYTTLNTIFLGGSAPKPPFLL